MKYRLLSMPSNTLSLRSSRREFLELKIWAKTNALKTTVWIVVLLPDVSSKPIFLTPKTWTRGMAMNQ